MERKTDSKIIIVNMFKFGIAVLKPLPVNNIFRISKIEYSPYVYILNSYDLNSWRECVI
jgi:hypothetical protein